MISKGDKINIEGNSVNVESDLPALCMVECDAKDCVNHFYGRDSSKESFCSLKKIYVAAGRCISYSNDGR